MQLRKRSWELRVLVTCFIVPRPFFAGLIAYIDVGKRQIVSRPRN